MLKNMRYLSLLLLVACAGKPMDVKNVVAPNPQAGNAGKTFGGGDDAQKSATIEIVHPKELGEQLKAYGRSTAKVRFELIKTVSYAQAGDTGQHGAAKVKNAVVDDYAPEKVTRIENITPGSYSHLSIWVDYVNEASSYSGRTMNEGITLKGGEVLRLSPKFLTIAEAECGGSEESSPRVSFYPSVRGANCKKPPINPQNLACIELNKSNKSTNCYITGDNKRCTAKASGVTYEITATTLKCGDPDIEMIRKLCYENVMITKDELAARECVDVP